MIKYTIDVDLNTIDYIDKYSSRHVIKNNHKKDLINAILYNVEKIYPKIYVYDSMDAIISEDDYITVEFFSHKSKISIRISYNLNDFALKNNILYQFDNDNEKLNFIRKNKIESLLCKEY